MAADSDSPAHYWSSVFSNLSNPPTQRPRGRRGSSGGMNGGTSSRPSTAGYVLLNPHQTEVNDDDIVVNISDESEQGSSTNGDELRQSPGDERNFNPSFLTGPSQPSPTDPGQGAAGGGGDTPGDFSFMSLLRSRGTWMDTVTKKYLFIIIIVLVKLAVDHRLGIFVFIGMIVLFLRSDSTIRHQIMLKDKRSVCIVLRTMVFLAVNIAAVYWVFLGDRLYSSLGYQLPRYDELTFWLLIWYVTVTDFVIKLATILIKSTICLLPSCLLKYRRRGNFYYLTERLSQLYRTVVPSRLWVAYILSSADVSLTGTVISYILLAVLAVFKVVDLGFELMYLWRAVRAVCSNTHYGADPSTLELNESGGSCPICHDDLTDPTKLGCKHIFCADCICVWFDKENTCPLCRFKVSHDPTNRDGGTAGYIQFY